MYLISSDVELEVTRRVCDTQARVMAIHAVVRTARFQQQLAVVATSTTSTIVTVRESTAPRGAPALARGRLVDFGETAGRDFYAELEAALPSDREPTGPEIEEALVGLGLCPDEYSSE